MTKSFMIALPLILCGCAAIEPNTINVGAEHLSSIEQHFGNDPTNVGVELATLNARWEVHRAYIEVQDAYIINGARFSGKGGRELFEARAGVAIWSKDH